MCGALTDDTLQLYVEGVLSPSAAAEVDAHLARCAGCRRVVVAYKLTFWELEHLPEPGVPAGLAEVSDRLMGAWVAHVAGLSAGYPAAPGRPETGSRPAERRTAWSPLRPALAGVRLGLGQVPGVSAVERGVRELGRRLPRAGLALAARFLRRGGEGLR